MPARQIAVLGAACLALSLSACEKKSAAEPAPLPTPQPTATVVHVVEVPDPSPSATTRPAVEVMEKPTACGAEKLQNYLNLIPTPTAKDEIAKTVGHNRIRYVGLAEAKASTSPNSPRLTGGLGPDGRIKQFSCG